MVGGYPMKTVELLAKRNGDGSYSVSYPSGDLVSDALVDFYNERTGTGYQRNETLRSKRGREIEEYVRRCVTEQMEPKLFEMTANARIEASSWRYDPLDDHGRVGFLIVKVPENEKWLSMIDGGTRLLGIENALAHNVISEKMTFDVRVFVGLTLAEEIAQFLLINENQKKVRTDLSLRVVQRQLDDGQLSDQEKRALETVVPDTDAWRYEASRIAAQMNADVDSPWRNRIQMPGDVTRPLTLQAFFTSLKPILADPDIKTLLEQMEKTGDLVVRET
jgi:DGQHR domain-containing protein